MKRTLSAAVLVAAGLTAAGAHAQTKTLYVGMNGGVMEKTFTQNVFPVFEKSNNVKVVVVPGTSSDILAKAQANKDNPQMHLMFLDDGIMYRAVGMGLCQKQRASPYLADLVPNGRLKEDMATAVFAGMTGLAYNTKMFQEKKWSAPTSWMDLADPKYKGKVVFQSLPSSTFGLHGFLMFNRIQGGSEKNVEPGFSAWRKTIGPNVIEYIPSSAKISEMAQTGEAGLFPLTPTQVATLKSKGIPVEYVNPKEGSVLLLTTQCVIAGNSEPDLTQKLAEHLLSPDAQALALQHGNYAPSNLKVEATGEAGEELRQMKEYLKTAVVVDWDVINESRPVWNNRWNRTIER